MVARGVPLVIIASAGCGINMLQLLLQSVVVVVVDLLNCESCRELPLLA